MKFKQRRFNRKKKRGEKNKNKTQTKTKTKQKQNKNRNKNKETKKGPATPNPPYASSLDHVLLELCRRA